MSWGGGVAPPSAPVVWPLCTLRKETGVEGGCDNV